MNKTYKLIFSKRLGVLLAVSEASKTASKGGSGAKRLLVASGLLAAAANLQQAQASIFQLKNESEIVFGGAVSY